MKTLIMNGRLSVARILSESITVTAEREGITVTNPLHISKGMEVFGSSASAYALMRTMKGSSHARHANSDVFPST